MRGAADRDDLAGVRIAQHDLRRLGAAIDAEEDASHSLTVQRPA